MGPVGDLLLEPVNLGTQFPNKAAKVPVAGLHNESQTTGLNMLLCTGLVFLFDH